MAERRSTMSQLGFDLFELLHSYWTFQRAMVRYTTDGVQGLAAHEFSITIRALEQDLILRLCRLADRSRSAWSLRDVVIQNRSRYSNEEHSLITEAIREFETLVAPLEKHHRNEYMAHQAKERAPEYKAPVQIRPAIRLAVRIGDLLSKEERSYGLGSDGESVDLRSSL